MFKNYWKISWRNMIKDRGYAASNIIGLAIGMSVALVIGLWVQYQLSYDRFLPGYEQAYRTLSREVKNGEMEGGNATSLPMAAAMKNDIPEIRYVAQTNWIGPHSLMTGDKKIYNNGFFAGEDFLHIFQYPLLKGDPSNALKEPASIVLSRSTAIALFGNTNPIGKIVRLDNQQEVKVTGILADIPANSTLQFDYIIPFQFFVQTQEWIRNNKDNWNLNPIQTFVGLQPNASYASVEAKLKVLFKKYTPDNYKAFHSEAFLQPVKDWHCYPDLNHGIFSNEFVGYIRMFACIGILVLIIACINFTNLSIARSERRAREVGVRKAMGSLRRDLILQFLVESLLVTGIAFGLSIILVSLSLPAFNQLTSSAIVIPWSHMGFWAGMFAYVLFTGLLAGSRPAFYLSSFRAVQVLKGALRVGKAAALPRRILVVLQFTCSVALIISTVIIYQQIQYARSRSTGYDLSQLVMTDASSDLDRNYPALKNELLQTGLVSGVTKATTPATDLYSWTGVDDWAGKYPNESLGIANIGVSEDYFKTLGMQLVEGHDFVKGAGVDTTDVIINQACVKRMRLRNPVGQIIQWNNHHPIRVIGVARDALMQSPFAPAEPTAFVHNNEWSNFVMYRLKPTTDAGGALARIGSIFNRYNPAYPYTYHFADERYAAKFSQEMLIGKLSGIFASLAILISCIGLFGLIAYVAQQRTKEIGIRKVLGASVSQILFLLSKEFIVLVTISCLIATAIAWHFLQGWLEGYYYRMTISPLVFVGSTVIALLVTLVTISLQAVRAALKNPVTSLRTE